MYVIMAYDIGEKRVNKVLKTGRKYLTWVQNSLLEGEITHAKFQKLKLEIKKITIKEEDSVYWYIFRDKNQMQKEFHGVEKDKVGMIV